MERTLRCCPAVSAVLCCICLAVVAAVSAKPNAAEDKAAALNDVHQTPFGTFDMHVCNWPERAPFFVAVFATHRAQDVLRVEVLRPDGRPLGDLALERFELRTDPEHGERRVFKSHFPLPQGAPKGWYRARLHTRGQGVVEARDYIEIKVMPQVRALKRHADELRWQPLPGATHYRVIIKDPWQDKRIVYKSDLLREPRLRLPAGALAPDGDYIWQVHARDTARAVKWGEFNHGSLSPEAPLPNS